MFTSRGISVIILIRDPYSKRAEGIYTPIAKFYFDDFLFSVLYLSIPKVVLILSIFSSIVAIAIFLTSEIPNGSGLGLSGPANYDCFLASSSS